MNVEVSNFGESAYQTKLYLKVLPEVSLINLRECDFENGSYVCLVARVLNGKVKKSFLFDLANLTPNYKEIPIHFKVESIGNDADLSDNELQVTIPVNFQNNPYLDRFVNTCLKSFPFIFTIFKSIAARESLP